MSSPNTYDDTSQCICGIQRWLPRYAMYAMLTAACPRLSGWSTRLVGGLAWVYWDWLASFKPETSWWCSHRLWGKWRYNENDDIMWSKISLLVFRIQIVQVEVIVAESTIRLRNKEHGFMDPLIHNPFVIHTVRDYVFENKETPSIH